MKKYLLKSMSILAAASVAALSLSLVSCGGSSGNNGELNIFTWTEYVPQSVIDKFEDETGIKCNVSTFSSNEDMLAKVRSEDEGAYDLIQPSDYMVEQMASQGMLEEIDTSKLTNLSNIGSEFLNPSYDPGNKYSVPYLGGVEAIAVNTDMIKDEITSYDDLFNPAYAGQEVVLDDFRAIIGMTAKSLGYSMSTTDRTELDEIKAKLLSFKPNVALFDSDSPKSALISGECALASVWSAEVALAMDEVPSIEVVYPDEGAYLFVDNWSIPKGAKNVDGAMQFINFMLDAENMSMVLEEFPYMCPNAKAVELMGEEYASNKAKNPPAEVIEKGEYIKNLDTETLAIYDQMWTELKK